VRERALNGAAENPRGDYVLYWMIAARRATWNLALDAAVDAGKRLDRPVLVFEPLRVGYKWASDRIHAYVMQGMADNAAAFARAGVTYFSYVEPEPGAGKGLLAALAARACLVVTDDFPAFFLPRMVASAAYVHPGALCVTALARAARASERQVDAVVLSAPGGR